MPRLYPFRSYGGIIRDTELASCREYLCDEYIMLLALRGEVRRVAAQRSAVK